ncbi:hypothetical protein GCM10010399_68720 [Dactylosporangium fulvum]|uniref:Uncharacterized protein n=1 Tax=Dactylosporangium fulvum TaxID=53359 RepID=A0ABY5VP39_9ACTN|nr:hypothetical protein [Dactylosporangium fulvum]UWP79448.1 hypothetical protein Dfulv_30305 [Dactylosporangium fulvum]
MDFDFARWAYDARAELPDEDFDLMLHDVSFLPFLVDTAADATCPKQHACAMILEDYTRRLLGTGRELPAVREAAARAAGQGLAGEWAAYAERVLTYHDRPGPVPRSKAEVMAHDLLVGDLHRHAMRAVPITVRVAGPATHWVAELGLPYPHFLYVHRRTGAFLWTFLRRLPMDEIAAVR